MNNDFHVIGPPPKFGAFLEDFFSPSPDDFDDDDDDDFVSSLGVCLLDSLDAYSTDCLANGYAHLDLIK